MDRYYLFRDPSEVEQREAEIDLQHVAPLNAWVRRLRKQLGPDAIIPWFDPHDGGCEAQILWLLEAPGPKATRERGGSGFISCNNNDATARNTWETRVEGGVSRELVVHWNIIPYYIGTKTRIRAGNNNDIAAVGPLLMELLALLPRIRVVILGGAKASKGWQEYGPQDVGLHIIECPHPSATNLNTRPGSRALVVDAWRKALEIVDG